MPLYDYDCRHCQRHFEQIVRSAEDPDGGTCPHCQTRGAARRVARFRVGGRGDLRESSEFHGCHSPLDTHHDHGSAGEPHVHSAGCGHLKGSSE